MEKIEKLTSHLTFNLDEESFAINVVEVISILEMTEITKIPKSPEFMKGVINLRGKVLPVIDIRKLFLLEEKEYDEKTCIIVTEGEKENKSFQVGFIVDNVQSVLDFEEGNIKDKPYVGNNNTFSEYISGIYEEDGKFIMILDFDKLLSFKEIINL
jgi:purine-binding chemotaxis protein CheW